jgi:glycosyltransferase involved in cell wall biosynthesis
MALWKLEQRSGGNRFCVANSDSKIDGSLQGMIPLHFKRREIQGVEMEKVSIAMATYNGAKFIIEQLESLARQSYPPDEVVVSDDCSTDGTLDLIETFAKKAPFQIRIFRNENNRGYRDNFMHAAGLCVNPIVAFCDQDDIWHADKILEAVKCFDDPSVKLVHHNANIVDADGRFLRVALDSRMLGERLAPRYFALGFTQVFRGELLAFSQLRDLSVDHQKPSQKLAHDQWIFFLAVALGQVVFIEKSLVDYRQHAQNAYGLRAENLLARTLKKIRHSVKSFPGVARFAESGADILLRISRNYPDSDPVKDGLIGRSKKFSRLNVWYQDRFTTYDDSRIGSRMRAWGRLAFSGAYGYSDPWAFGAKNLLADATLGVMLGSFFKRLSDY